MKKAALGFVLFFFSLCSLSQEETSVLFIGNSFTFMNDMPLMFQKIAEAKGKKVHVEFVVEGGKDFSYHSSQPITYQTINSRKWDYIILQGHSNELTHPQSIVDQNSLPYAKKIVDSIRHNSACTQLILYMTWGYKNGNPKWSAVATYDSMQYRITNQYMRFADLLDARISPVGEVWKTVKTNYIGVNLYDPDLFHPSYVGSYLAACTHFTTIFGESPLRNNAEIAIEETTRQMIEMNASQIVLNNLNQWRYIQKTKLDPGFDLILQNDFLELKNRSENYTWLEWDFGDGQSSKEENPQHCYSDKGVYVVKMNTSNSCDSLVIERQIEVK